MIMDSVDELKQLLSETGMATESESARKLLTYLKLLIKWNTRINLTASTEWRSLKRLFLEGIEASKIYPAEASAHLDIGSGAGFPAIILRILTPRMKLELVESRSKKSFFLETVIHALDLRNTQVHAVRLESMLRECDPKRIWDCVTWKGLKLHTDELQGLLQHADDATQFWMFHGREPAVKEWDVFMRHFRLLGQEKMGGGKDWALSIYSRRSAVGSGMSQIDPGRF
jgi:16S rRNA (guanine(527)-N(7))-methyltransferase RsmG